jgi:two-component system response regulator AdeR
MVDNELAQNTYLVVDDDEFSREFIGGVLAHLGCNNVHCAADSESAIRVARLHKPEFVLLDIYMPEVDGWTFLGHLRKTLPSALVIMITGSGKVADFRKSMTETVDGYCVKPVSPGVLQRALTSAKLRRQELHV